MAARIVAYAPAPPSSSLATIGVSTQNGASTSRWKKAKCVTLAQTHVRELNSRQPSTRSATKRDRASRVSRSIRSEARKAALTRKVTLSTAKAQPAPTVATSTPATAGPTTLEVDRESWSRPFACWSRGTADRLRDEPRRGGVEERLRGAVDRHQHHQVPDLRPAGEQEQRRRGPASPRARRRRRASRRGGGDGRPRPRRRARARPSGSSARRRRARARRPNGRARAPRRRARRGRACRRSRRPRARRTAAGSGVPRGRRRGPSPDVEISTAYKEPKRAILVASASAGSS